MGPLCQKNHLQECTPTSDSATLPGYSRAVILDKCIIEFLALQVKTPRSLDMKKSDVYMQKMPKIMRDHVRNAHCGSLKVVLQAHPALFDFCSDTKVKLSSHFSSMSVLSKPDNIKLVHSFRVLLQQLGAVTQSGAKKKNRCSFTTVRRYMDLMEADTKQFLTTEYGSHLDIFFILNSHFFQTNCARRGSVYLQDKLPKEYTVVVYLKQQLQMKNAFPGSAGVSVEVLVLEGRDSQVPKVGSFFRKRNTFERLRALLRAYPTIFKRLSSDRVCLEKAYATWKEWNCGMESLTVLYFIEVLKGVGATCPNGAVCFNYILYCMDSAPPECRSYLSDVFPRLDVFDLFHLHPEVFDLSVENAVCLISTRVKFKDKAERAKQRKNIHEVSTQYVAQLLRYAPNLTAAQLSICVETASQPIRRYTHLHLPSVYESSKKLQNQESCEDDTNPIHRIRASAALLFEEATTSRRSAAVSAKVEKMDATTQTESTLMSVVNQANQAESLEREARDEAFHHSSSPANGQ